MSERKPFHHKMYEQNRIPSFAPTHAQPATQTISDVFADKSSPTNDHVANGPDPPNGDAANGPELANGYAPIATGSINGSSSNSKESTNGSSPNVTVPRNVYYYCSGLDVSAGGTIDCGSAVGTNAADGPVDATRYSTLR